MKLYGQERRRVKAPPRMIDDSINLYLTPEPIPNYATAMYIIIYMVYIVGVCKKYRYIFLTRIIQLLNLSKCLIPFDSFYHVTAVCSFVQIIKY